MLVSHQFTPLFIFLMLTFGFGYALGYVIEARDPRKVPMQNFSEVIQNKFPDDASCDDLKADVEGPHSPMWDDISATAQLREWMNKRTNTTDLCFELANPLGVGNTVGCGTNSICEKINCRDLDDPGRKGIGWQYTTLVSCANLNHYLTSLNEGLVEALGNVSSLRDELANTFFLPPDTKSLLIEKEIVNGVAFAIILSGIAIGGPAAGIVTNAIAGGLFAWLNSLSAKDDTIANMAILDLVANNQNAQGQKMLMNMSQDWTSIGNWNGISLTDVFDHGAFLDDRNIPILNHDKSLPIVDRKGLTDYFSSYLFATLINTAWKLQGVFLACYPMSQEEFDGLKVKAGTNDPRLKYFHPEYQQGCYFQSATPRIRGWNTVPVAENPPGWGLLGQGPYPFTTSDVMKASVEAFYGKDGGYNYNTSRAFDGAIGEAGYFGLDRKYDWPGLFNIPVCQLDSNTLKTMKLKDWANALNEPDNGFYLPSYCLCYETPDANNKTLADAIDLKRFDSKKECEGPDV